MSVNKTQDRVLATIIGATARQGLTPNFPDSERYLHLSLNEFKDYPNNLFCIHVDESDAGSFATLQYTYS